MRRTHAASSAQARRISRTSPAVRRCSARRAKFKSIVRRAGVAPAQTIAIGDEVRDIEAARAAGIACGAVAWGYAAPEALAAQAPDMMFSKMKDVEQLIGSDAL